MAYKIAAVLVLLFVFSPLRAQEPHDPWLWLEEIDGINALAWVTGQNDRTARELKTKPQFQELYKQALNTLNSESRIPSVTQRGKWLYNLWRDAAHPRGIYRRTTIEEFRKEEPPWETVIDVDLLSEKENKQWVLDEVDCLSPEYRHCLVALAPGGTDATELREFDMNTFSFVEDGFFLPVSKSNASWIDENTLFVGADLGKSSMTESGYPRTVRLWKRGVPIEKAPVIYEADPKSVSVSGYRIKTEGGNIDLVTESKNTWNSISFQRVDNRLEKLNLPESAVIEGGIAGRLVVSLQEDSNVGSQHFVEGSVIVADPSKLRGGEGSVELLIAPTETEVVEGVIPTDQGILIETMENIQGRLYRYNQKAGSWRRTAIPFPDNGAIEIKSVDDKSGNFFVQFETFLTPPTLYYVASIDLKPEKMKAQEPTFNGSQFDVQQRWTKSKDGTRVPYFTVMKKGTPMNGKNPTHIFSYGGFRNSLTPSYSGSYEQLSGAYGKLWLERGGLFVLANIRGGGEFGPAWHRAALRENRVKAFEDFEAITRDLIQRKITSAEHIGIEGRSNGGLLVMALITRNPELYGAVICGSPLVDMLRYHKLLAGASWMAEYGNPDIPADRAFLEKYSPYQLLKKGENYPPVFFYASTRDDRVHPGHARKTVAKMLGLGYTSTYYFENTEGGHGASSTNEQLAYRLALAYTHLWQHLR